MQKCSGHILDSRAASDFLRGHLPGSVNLPLEELPARIHELPAPGAAITVVDADASRAEAAGTFLRARGFTVTIRLAAESDCTESGLSRAHLWAPTPLLRQVLEQQPALAGRALDLACGSGRDAVFMALHGLQVEAADVLPDALAKAQDLAQHCGVSLTLRQMDLRRPPQLEPHAYTLVTMFRFLHRPLLPLLPRLLAPGGLLLIEAFHERSRHTAAGPRKETHLLRTGELSQLCHQANLNILHAADGLERAGRFFSQLIAQSPPQ